MNPSSSWEKKLVPEKNRLLFSPLLENVTTKKMFLKAILKCMLLMPQSRSMQFLFPNSCKRQFCSLYVCQEGFYEPISSLQAQSSIRVLSHSVLCHS